MSNLRSLFILFLNLACFIFPSSSTSKHHLLRRLRRTPPSSTTPFKSKLTSTKKSFSSFFTRLFSSSTSTSNHPHPPPSFSSPPSSVHSLRIINPKPPIPDPKINTPKTPTNLFPCTICGEILHSTPLLDHHKSTKHAISELIDGENIVRIIFKMGWPDKRPAAIHRILKIHNAPKVIFKFEEYRELVKNRASTKLLRDERCIADGNELLRFYCTTFICELDSGLCNQQYCSVCGIIRNGFSPKMDGISTMPTSWKAHQAVPENLEEEFGFLKVKRALLVCRVVAGRVGCVPGLVDKEDPGFDSLVGRVNGGDEEDELLVFNPRAVLPCFVIVYTV